MATFTGTSGNDSWTVVNPGTFTLDGLGGTDTLYLGTSLRSSYTITRSADGAVHVDSVSGASAALHATLLNMEALVFDNKKDTLTLSSLFGDTAAPTLVSASPADEATAVPVGSSIVLTFSEPVLRGQGRVLITDAGGTVLASYDAATSSNLTVTGATLTIDPGTDFAPGSAVRVQVELGAVKDAAGNAYAGLSTYNFTTAAAPVLLGTAADDRLTPTPGVSAVDAGAGIDTVVLGSSAVAYQLQATGSGFTLSAIDGSTTLALTQVERLQFSDRRLALDLDGHAGQVARILGAVFGADAVKNASFVGIGLQYSDGGMSVEALMQLALDARLGSLASHGDVVTLLYTNVVGQAPPPADLALYTGLLDNRTYSPASLGVMAADTTLNLANIDLAGLAANGLPFSA